MQHRQILLSFPWWFLLLQERTLGYLWGGHLHQSCLMVAVEGQHKSMMDAQNPLPDSPLLIQETLRTQATPSHICSHCWGVQEAWNRLLAAP